MKKIKAFVYVFVNSISNPSYTNSLVKTHLSFSIKYLLALAVIASLVSIPTIIYPATKQVDEVIAEFESYALGIYPEDLVITIESGELSINQPEPLFIEIPGNTEQVEGIENLVVFDTNGTLDDVENYNTFVLANRKNVLVRNTNNIEVYPLAESPDGELNKEMYIDFYNQLQPFFTALPYLVMVFGFLAVFIYYFFFRLIYLLIVGLGLLIVGSIRNVNLGFSNYYQIAIHAMTIPLVLDLISKATNINIPLNGWFILLNLLIGLIGLMGIKKAE